MQVESLLWQLMSARSWWSSPIKCQVFLPERGWNPIHNFLKPFDIPVIPSSCLSAMGFPHPMQSSHQLPVPPSEDGDTFGGSPAVSRKMCWSCGSWHFGTWSCGDGERTLSCRIPLQGAALDLERASFKVPHIPLSGSTSHTVFEGWSINNPQV